MTPTEYCDNISMAIEKAYPLYHMEREDFLDIEIMLKSQIATRRPVLAKAFQTAAQIIVTSDYPQGYILKDKYDLDDKDGKKVSVVHHTNKNKKFDLGQVDLPHKYPQERILDNLKVKDLQNLMMFMGEAGGWIKDLVDRQKALDSSTAPNSPTDEGEDDPEEVDGYDRSFEYEQRVRYNTRSQN